MYKVKLSPEEVLETIKLRMKYDSSKTLNENVNLIQEQDLEKDVDTVNKELGSLFRTDEENVVDILKKYDTTDKFNQFLNKFKEITKTDLGTAFGNSFAPSSDVSEWNQLTDHLKGIGISLKHEIGKGGDNITKIGGEVPATSGEVPATKGYDSLRRVKEIKDTVCTAEKGTVEGRPVITIGPAKGNDLLKWAERYGVTNQEIEEARKSCGKKDSNAGGGSTPKVTIPTELKDVKDFHDWLDKTHPGWHDKYNTLDQNVSKGYGKFGPRTTKAWARYKNDYLKKTPTVTPTPTGNPDLEVDDKEASLDQPF
jgi:hypothetical protein